MSEKDREANTIAFQLEAEFGAMYGNNAFHSGVLKRLLEALATARAEGHRAGMLRAAEIAYDYDGDGISKSGQDWQLGDASLTRSDIAAAIRAAAGEGDPK